MPIKIAGYESLVRAENAVVGIFSDSTRLPQDLPTAWVNEIGRLRALGDVTGKAEEVHVFYPVGTGARRVLLCGLGEQKKLNLGTVRKAVGRAMKRAQVLRTKTLTLVLESFAGNGLLPEETAQALILAASLAQYQYREYKTAQPDDDMLSPVRLTLAACRPTGLAAAIRTTEGVAEAANYARTLANRPGNKLFPQDLAAEARNLARQYPKLRLSVLDFDQLKKTGLHALAAVGQGSAHAPVLAVLQYTAGRKTEKPVVLVGKGITFDSGGICLKPSANMENMKFDMSGAAAVLGVVRAVAALRLPLNLVGVVPAAENMPSGSATRPGDVVTSLSGQTIEILNTDAEGRLILADALAYAQRFKPACLVDIATLTGAVVVALGHVAMAVLSNDDKLAAELQAAGNSSGERAWPLPLWDEYRDLLKSDVADTSNMGSKPGAGTIVGAAFLEKFAGRTPWAHLDIAGVAYGDAGPIYAKGATGAGVRIIMEWLLQKIKK